MQWTHSRIMSTADEDGAMVVQTDAGWDAFPYGLDGGTSSAFATREAAIEAVEMLHGEIACCVGHLAADSDHR